MSEFKDSSGAWVTTRYGDGFVEGCQGEGEKRFDERHPVLVVPVPGASAWVVEKVEGAARASVVQFGDREVGVGGGGGQKRGWEGVGVERGVENTMGDQTGQKKSVTFDVDMGDAKEGENKESGEDGENGENGENGKETQGGLPSASAIPRGSCVVHVYGENIMKLNDVVEVLGVISRVPELASGAMYGLEEEGAVASMVPTSVAPRLHAVCVRKVDVGGMLGGLGGLPCPTIRERIVGFLKGVLKGDALAAEYVLMQLISRVHRRAQGGIGNSQDTQLGTAALNITGVADADPDGFSKKLGEALSQLMPSVVRLPLDIDALNRRPWYPTKVGDCVNGSAVLQLPAGAVLVLDETAMRAGQLTETGLKNLGAIQTMMQSQKLPYDFQFYQLEQPTDQPIIIASVGKTMLKGAGEIQVALAGEHQSEQRPFEGDVEAARGYLAAARSMAFSIPQALEQQLESDMTDARKKDSANVNAETFHSWLNLARLLCLSHGEGELSLERWRQVLAMEAERLRRIGV